MSLRKKGCLFLAVLFFAIFAGIPYYSLKIEPRWIEVTKHKVLFSNFPSGVPPLKLVLIGDMHFGSYNGAAFYKGVVERINRLDPDIVILAGDFVTDAKYSKPCAAVLTPLKARLGKYAVFGGHDYQEGATVIKRDLETAEIKVLKNGNIEIEKDIRLIAVDDFTHGKPDIRAAFSGIPKEAIRIVVTHNPKLFPLIKEKNCAVLAAHTHAGQLDVPGIPRNQLPGLMSYEYIRGWYHDGNSRLYVNRGIGTVIPFMRFRARPEISVFTFAKGIPGISGMKKNDPIDSNSHIRRLAARLLRVLKPIYMKASL